MQIPKIIVQKGWSAFLLLAAAGVVSLQAQVSNTGQLVITPGTQVSTLSDFNNTATGSLMNDGELFIYSNFNNDGLISFVDAANDGFTRFEGLAVQQITGSEISEFYNVLFNNGTAQTAFELSGHISVVNEAEFNFGVVRTEGFGGSIIFEQLADHVSTSDDSHVDGLVHKRGDTTFDFPIGDSGFYRNATISAPDNATDIFSSRYVLENSNTAYPHSLTAGVIELINDAEYWILNREQGNSDVVLTLGWSDDTTPAAISASPTSAIHIVRWDADEGFWVDEGGIVDDLSQTVTTITNVSGYGVYTLARVEEELVLPGGVVIYNGLSPNGDGDNDFFLIDGLERHPDNTVQIFNRWGAKVFETSGYNNSDNVFDGTSRGSLTISKNEQLPTGTYFYIINYTAGVGSTSQAVKKAGYLYINKDDH
ncbi:gliding motility-associated C-terminal domain-containing protein [Seonamhaeicola sp.]|uniref:gliding motility-associated C-terminal domain-containing protein n=1 Tax=Seonamhaeicola sp. TaxID=1912245 RepID=UPI00261EC00A|nr:gliding motility-associated C-terminal domain-containing protein [Seonamhaeicola sp.]